MYVLQILSICQIFIIYCIVHGLTGRLKIEKNQYKRQKNRITRLNNYKEEWENHSKRKYESTKFKSLQEKETHNKNKVVRHITYEELLPLKLSTNSRDIHPHRVTVVRSEKLLTIPPPLRTLIKGKPPDESRGFSEQVRKRTSHIWTIIDLIVLPPSSYLKSYQSHFKANY